jgi:hypothetical protein
MRGHEGVEVVFLAFAPWPAGRSRTANCLQSSRVKVFCHLLLVLNNLLIISWLLTRPVSSSSEAMALSLENRI